MGQRSVAGSVRGYGAVSTRVSPSEQAPRVSKLGQRVGHHFEEGNLGESVLGNKTDLAESVDDNTSPICLLHLGHSRILQLGTHTAALPEYRYGPQP